MLLNLPVRSSTSPLPAPSIVQAFVPSACVIVSLPSPPSILPPTVAPLAMLKVSLPVPPTRSSMPVTSPVTSVTVIAVAPMFQVFVPSS